MDWFLYDTGLRHEEIKRIAWRCFELLIALIQIDKSIFIFAKICTFSRNIILNLLADSLNNLLLVKIKQDTCYFFFRHFSFTLVNYR